MKYNAKKRPCQLLLTQPLGSMSVCECSFLWEDDLVVAAQVHEGKEAEQTVIVSIEVAVLEWLVLGVPEGINKFLALVLAAHHGCCC